MADPTEGIRREMVGIINSDPSPREALEAQYGQVWDTAELRAEFEVLAFLAPFVMVRRLSDGAKGTLMFRHHPRHYFGWQAD